MKNLTTIFDNRPSGAVLGILKFGSYLYGTQTPSSDSDYKVIYKMDLRDIIFNKKIENKFTSTGSKDSKNNADDIDVEYIELRKFVRDCFAGQTYALEILFAPDLEYSSTEMNYLRANKNQFLSNNLKPFVGYCKAQASKYGLKGERYTATKDAAEFISKHLMLNSKATVDDIITTIPKNEHVKIVESKLSGQDKIVQLLQINEKQFVFSDKLSFVQKIVDKHLESFGERAKRASEGVDWKALSHAFRVLYEYEELLTTKSISFPLKEAEFLRDIKLGKIDFDELQKKFVEDYDRIIELESPFPEEVNQEQFNNWMYNLYVPYFLTNKPMGMEFTLDEHGTETDDYMEHYLEK